MKRPAKRIISCALTGAIHTPTMSDALPITPAEMIEQGVAAVEAGAAILHLHARDSNNGRPVFSRDEYLKFIPELAATGVVINITTGGSPVMTMEQRLEGAQTILPEVASLNLGTMNFNFAGAGAKITEWKYDWEKEYVLGSSGRIFQNTFEQIESTLTHLHLGEGVRFEFECYDIGHLYTLDHFVKKGLVKPPYFIQGVFGILGGIGSDPDNLTHMTRIADKLFGDDYYFSAFGAGRMQMTMVTASVLAGGHARVGLEDNIYIGRGTLAKSNAEQVHKAVRILDELSLEPATPDEVREMLGTKGRDTLILS